jgi:hypothetical protein
MIDSISALHRDQGMSMTYMTPVSAGAQAMIIASVKVIRWMGI